MTNLQPGWYQDAQGATRWWDGVAWTDHVQNTPHPDQMTLGEKYRAAANAGAQVRPGGAGQNYVVLQVVLKEKLWGAGSNNLVELEQVINQQAALGYRLHTITTAAGGSAGFGGGDRIQATMVFERIERIEQGEFRSSESTPVAPSEPTTATDSAVA